MDDKHLAGNKIRKEDANKCHRDGAPGTDLWTDGLICAFELVKSHRMTYVEKPCPRIPLIQRKEENALGQVYNCPTGNAPTQILNENNFLEPSAQRDLNNIFNIQANGVSWSGDSKDRPKHIRGSHDSHWVPIGWSRISELVQMIQSDSNWSAQQIDLAEEEDGFTVADVATPYWERPAGPTWWCHVTAGHDYITKWLSNAQWLHPAISIALRDESRLISEKMKHLLYEVPVRVSGGLLFELLGQSVGDPFRDEDDIPIVLRSWQAQNFLLTVLHVKGSSSNINVVGITEVQEFLLAGGNAAPKSSHEVIGHLACRLSRWDDRLFRKYVFGAADEIELKFVNRYHFHESCDLSRVFTIFLSSLKFKCKGSCIYAGVVNRRNHEDLNLLSIILNQEIRRLATQVIRVKWSLHAREEIIFELLQHLRGNMTRALLEGINKSTREMLEEQEAVRGRLFTVQDVMQSTVRAWLQDRSLRVNHNLAIFGGGGLVLSIITGLFGINVDGIPGAENTPYAFGLFAGMLFFLGIILIGLGMLYLGLQNPITEEKVEVRKLELQQLVSMFQHDAETHAKVRENVSRQNLSPTAADMLPESGYLLIT